MEWDAESLEGVRTLIEAGCYHEKQGRFIVNRVESYLRSVLHDSSPGDVISCSGVRVCLGIYVWTQKPCFDVSEAFTVNRIQGHVYKEPAFDVVTSLERYEPSYIKAVKVLCGRKLDQPRIRLDRACRLAVQKYCDGHRLAPDHEVDHLPPWEFHVLKKEWVEAEGGTGKISLRDAGRMGWKLADPAQRRRWVEFHHERAELESISYEEHRRRSGERRKKA